MRARLAGLTVVLALGCDGAAKEGPGPPAASASASAAPSAALPAPLPAVSGRLFFVSERDGDREVYAVAPDGSGETRITRRAGDDYVAPIGPLGEVLLVEVDETDGGHLERLALFEAGASRVVGRPSGRVRSPVFVPGGVLFESDAESFRDLYRLDLATGAITRLTRSRTGAFEPSVAKDGSLVVYASSDEGDPDLYSLPLLGAKKSTPLRLTWSRGEDSGPVISPDGGRIAFVSVRDGVQRIALMGRDGSHPRLLRSALGEGTLAERDPTWSPDGAALAWVEQQKDRALLRVTDLESQRDLVREEGAQRDELPVWSPDGRFVAFTREREKNVDVYVIAREGGAARRVTTAPAPDWLPRWAP